MVAGDQEEFISLFRQEGFTPLLMSVEDIARLLGLSEPSVRKLMSDGVIESVKIGTRRLGKTYSVAKLADEGIRKINPKWRTAPRVRATPTVGKPIAKKRSRAAREAAELEA
jgi:excisionase family DNA binding protein